MKERNRNIRYPNGVSARLKNKRITVYKSGEDHVFEFVTVQENWKDEYAKDFDFVFKRCGIAMTVKSIKLSQEGVETMLACYYTLQSHKPKGVD